MNARQWLRRTLAWRSGADARPRRAAAFACALVAATGACSTKEPKPPPPTAPVIVGVSLGLTGSLGASFTVPLQNATHVAEAQINALGGVLGRPVQMKVVDDQSDEDKVVKDVVGGLIADGAVALIGPAGSQQVVATAQLAADAHVIMISPSATSPTLTDMQPAHDRYFFRTTPPDDLQGKAVVLFALRGPPGALAVDGGAADSGLDGGRPASVPFCSRLAIVHIDNSYGNAMADVIVKYMGVKGGTVPANITVPVTAGSSYKNEVAEVLAASPQCMALIAYDDVGDAFMHDLTNSPTPPPASFIVIGTDGIYTPAFITNGRQDKSNPASPTVAEGVYGTNPDTNPPTTEFGDFANLYNAYFPLAKGVQPDPYTANAYDAAILIMLAIIKADTTTDGPKIRDALFDVSRGGRAYGPAQLADAIEAIKRGEDIDYKGASGEVDFDDKGNIIGDYIVWKVVNGKYPDQPVDRIKAAELLQ